MASTLKAPPPLRQVALPAGAYVISDRQVEVETPEHVAVGYELADLGSRFTALLIDFCLVFFGQLAVWLALLMLGALAGLGTAMGTGVGAGLAVLASFAIYWGYYVFFEGLRDGQTLGKKWMGIRVVQDGGYPVTFRAAAIRNLIRIVDLTPACGIGGLAMMLSPQTKRLGDMAAGTVVVRDRTGQPIPEDAQPDAAAAALGSPRLSSEEFAALSMFVERAHSLAPEVRIRLAGTLTQRLERHFRDDPRRQTMGFDSFLALVHGEEGARRRASGAGGRAGTAQATALFRRQKPVWAQYEHLLQDARRRGLDKLGEAQVSRFAGMYREVAADLARARTYGGSPELIFALERSVGSGHNLLYRPPVRSWRRFWGFIGGGFPALVRRRWKPILVASLLFYLPGVLAFAAIRHDPALARELMPAEMMARAEEAQAKEARGEGYVEVPQVTMPVMSSRIISNNIQVTFMAFAGGILASLGTVAVLLFNGVFLGAVAGLFANYGQSLHLWSFVLPHGVIELTAICIAGGAGLWMGSGMILPGRLTRREALTIRAREAVSLIGGTAVMLLVAGTIEGFISPSELPRPAKLAFAALTAVALVAYLLLAGRGKEAVTSAEETASR
ncbi:MAG TPA: stage II sporulation protein M [Longimicrobium sp.]|nr:stage II sporulation protein M [Longimicrobium sp.]